MKTPTKQKTSSIFTILNGFHLKRIDDEHELEINLNIEISPIIAKVKQLNFQLYEIADLQVTHLIGEYKEETVFKGILSEQTIEHRVLIRSICLLNAFDIIMKEFKILSLLSESERINFLGVIINKECKEIYFLYKGYEYNLKFFMESKLDCDKALLTAEIFRILILLHSNGIVYGDLNLKNIWLTSSNKPSIISFTNSYLITDGAVNFLQGFTTPMYVPPELSLMRPNYGTFQDIWALGCLMIEIYLDYTSYSTDSLTNLKNDIYRFSIPPKIPLEIKENIAVLIANCIVINPAIRPHIAEMTDKLNLLFKEENLLRNIKIDEETLASV